MPKQLQRASTVPSFVMAPHDWNARFKQREPGADEYLGSELRMFCDDLALFSCQDARLSQEFIRDDHHAYVDELGCQFDRLHLLEPPIFRTR